jgi:hypothetical protein
MTDFHNLPDLRSPTRAVWDDILSRGQELYDEYCRTPIGAHSPNLQFILQHFRKAPCEGKYVLVAIEPHRRWVLGTLTGRRGDTVRIEAAVEFDDLDKAERYVFRRRWKTLFGQDLKESW